MSINYSVSGSSTPKRKAPQLLTNWLKDKTKNQIKNSVKEYLKVVEDGMQASFIESGMNEIGSNSFPLGYELSFKNIGRDGDLILRIIVESFSSYKAIFIYKENKNQFEIEYYSKDEDFLLIISEGADDEFLEFIKDDGLLYYLQLFFMLSYSNNFEFILSKQTPSVESLKY